jgi:hypothetical protein
MRSIAALDVAIDPSLMCMIPHWKSVTPRCVPYNRDAIPAVPTAAANTARDVRDGSVMTCEVIAAMNATSGKPKRIGIHGSTLQTRMNAGTALATMSATE